MIKGSYTAIVISVLLHVLVLLALIYSANKQPKTLKQDKTKFTSIKSFLYTAPKITKAKKVPLKKIIVIKDFAEKVVAEIKPAKKTAAKKVVAEKLASEQKSSKQAAAKSPETKNKVPGVSQGSFSSYDRLSRLRTKLDRQQRQQAFAELTQKRSDSIMHGEPFPVPKSFVPLTTEQKYKQNTSTSHVGSITKNDNGTCTIYREQMLGSPVEATTASFACGESKFDKSFREHMQKVQVKLGIKR